MDGHIHRVAGYVDIKSAYCIARTQYHRRQQTVNDKSNQLTRFASGVLLSVPFGILADRWGRKPVLNLSLVGYLLGEAWARVVCM